MSLIIALERAKENTRRFKKAKCDVEWIEHKLSTQEKLQKDALRLAKEYMESAKSLEVQIETNKKRLDNLYKFINENESIIGDSTRAEELYEKMMKLQAQVDKLKSQISAEVAVAK